MLDPHGRKLYLEALKPPAGYTLDRGVATTYSLDLLTLLIVPLSFVLFDYEGVDDLKDQTKMLEALQRTSERLRIYCQRGRINIPRVNHLLYSYLEKTVLEVDLTGGAFHPKTWLLRFTAHDRPAVYRFICLSRNLTFDKSWDTLLALDGHLLDTIQSENKPLLDFLSGLPVLAGHPDQGLDWMLEEVQRVKFEAPPGFNETLSFFPLGIDGYTHTPLMEEAEKLLIVSPFVSDGLLKRVTEMTGAECVLISRLESLDALEQNTLERFKRIFVLDEPEANEAPEADILRDEVDHTGKPDAVAAVEEHEQIEPHINRTGLHAKLFVMEKGKTTKVLTGSANATLAAFHGNVEFMVEMQGERKRININNLLSADKNPFGTMLREYRRTVETVVDHEVVKLELKVEDIRRKIAACTFELRAFAGEQGKTYDLEMSLLKGSLNLGEDTDVLCWPITLHVEQAKALSAIQQEKLVFKNISTVAVTGFVAFQVTAYGATTKRVARFVLNLPLIGMPEDRHEKILLSIISNKNRFLRYLLFLLAEGQLDLSRLIDNGKPGDGNGKPTGESGTEHLPLLEEMVRALSRSPEKIDRIARLVQKLRKTEEGRNILPDDFELIWSAIWEARQRMVKT